MSKRNCHIFYVKIKLDSKNTSTRPTGKFFFCYSEVIQIPHMSMNIVFLRITPSLLLCVIASANLLECNWAFFKLCRLSTWYSIGIVLFWMSNFYKPISPFLLLAISINLKVWNMHCSSIFVFYSLFFWKISI